MSSQNSSNTVLCGLLADKPTNLSESMHNAAFKNAGLPYVYVAFDTKDTAGALAAAKTLGIRGLSLTIPHKEAALSYLNEVSPEAAEIGAVNTLIFKTDQICGFNTDWIGVGEAFKEVDVDLSGKRVLVFGAGGASRAAIYAMKQMKASQVVIVNRNEQRAASVAKSSGIDWQAIASLNEEMLTSFDVFINCTPIGSKLDPSGQYPFDIACFRSSQVVFDMVTNETPLLRSAASCGAKTIAGQRMLLFQAIEQFKLFTDGVEPSRKVMEEALLKVLRE